MRKKRPVKQTNDAAAPPFPMFRATPRPLGGPAARQHRESAAARAPDGGGQFIAYFQPRVRLSDGAVLGFEALARWRANDGTIVPPAVFLPRLTERTTLLLRMLEGVLATSAQWRGQGIDLPVSVNIEARQLVQPEFTEAVFTLAARYPC